MLGGSSFLFGKSAKQKTVSTSSTEAEITALVDAVKTSIWLQDLIQNIGLIERSPIIVYQDNQSAIQLVSNIDNKAKGSRHFLVRLTYLRELSTEQKIMVEYLQTDDMAADMLTKPTVGKKFKKHMNKIMGSVRLDQRGVLADISYHPNHITIMDMLLYSNEILDQFTDKLTL